jgi:hypothetical protein
MVTIEASDDLPQPHPLPWDGLVHSPTQLVLHFLELGHCAITPGFPAFFAAAMIASGRLEAEVIRIGAAGREPDGHGAPREVRWWK